MSNPELQALLANLRPRSQASQVSTSRISGRDQLPRDPSSPFPSASQIPSTPPPPFSPALSTANAAPNNALAQNLLSLLNFNQRSSQSAQPATQPQLSDDATDLHATSRQPSRALSDLVARSSSEQDTSFVNPPSTAPATELNTKEEHNTDAQPDISYDTPKANSVQVTSETGQQRGRTQSPAPAQDGPKSMFTYKNPFEALRASRPLTPRSSNPPAATAPQQPPQDLHPVESIEDSDMQEELNKIMPDRIKLTPKSRVSTQSTSAQWANPGQDVQEETLPDINGHGLHTGAAEPPTPNLESAPAAPAVEEEAVELTDATPANKTVLDEGGGQPATSSDEERVVTVLSFPVKAFVSITLQLKDPATAHVRENGVMEIARLKRDFDQIDRSLAAASSKFITYALVNKGGMRIIRQDDGKDRHIFKHTHDRIFNASICTTSTTAAPGPHQAVLGTGVSGSVYYATISKPDEDLFDTNNLDSESLIFPAYPQADENTAGGVLKTRAKRSSKHPEFFAIGRGKSIHIVWPSVVMSPRYGVSETERKVNIEKLFQDRPLQILTGKAGKDFTFSEDDTVVVSLDKTGRLRFWDIRKLIDEENARAVQIAPYIIDTPLLSLSTASPAERSWPTSVLFVDKARPYIKGGPLRYVLVGLRQNHTLQLWDIALGKAVQEISFPHESEADGICSVAYHSASGIIVVGHPTRNSLFFIHLSAPRYVLSSSLSQASYIQRVAAKDPEIPKPESTACMSGIREISFEGRGQLRSVELLPVYKPAESSTTIAEDESLFELYVAHSTGVTCLMINKKDLGWDKDNKSIRSINAEQEGLVSIKKLELGSVIEEHARSKSPPQEQTVITKSAKKKNKKAKDGAEESVNGVQDVPAGPAPTEAAPQQLVPQQPAAQVEQAPSEPSVVKESKKSKKKKEAQAQAEAAAAASQKEIAKPASPEKMEISQPAETSAQTSRYNLRSQAQPEQVSMGISGDWLDKEIKKIEKGVALEFKRELMQLYDNVKTDRASQDQASAARQEAVLRVVSTTLSTNVEKTLSSIISTQMQDVLIPQVVQSVSADLSNKVLSSISQIVHQELVSVLSTEVKQTLQTPQLLQRVGDDISHRLTGQISKEISNTINTTVAATMQNVAAVAASEVVASTEARLMDQVAQLQRQQTAQVETLNQVNLALQSVAQTVQAMSQAQVAFQNQVLEDRRSAQAQAQAQAQVHAQAQEHARSASIQHAPPPPPPQAVHQPQPIQHRVPSGFTASPGPSTRAIPARQRTKAELETEEVTALMEHRKYEEGSIKWLQSSQPVKLFDDLFVRFTPDYLATDVSPLVAFSIGVTVANSLSTNTEQRLQWISAALDAIDFKDREINELAPHAPNLVSSLIQKLDSLYIAVAKSDSESILLDMISPLSTKARNVREMFVALATGRGVLD